MLRGRTFGLTPPAVELLVGAALLERWPAGEEIVTAEMLERNLTLLSIQKIAKGFRIEMAELFKGLG
jgi:hypothetical protein